MSNEEIRLGCLGVAQAWIAHSPLAGEEYGKRYKKENLVKLAAWLADWVVTGKQKKEG